MSLHSILLFLLCLLLFSTHPTGAQRSSRTTKPPTRSSHSLNNRTTPADPPHTTTTSTDPTNVRGGYTPRTIRKDPKGGREEEDPGFIPWVPALPAHTGGKPWNYKTGDGVIHERGEAKEGKAEEEGSETRVVEGEEGEADSLDAELAPKAKKASKKDSSRAGSGKRPPVKPEQQTSEADTDTPQTTAASTRASKRGRGSAPSATVDDSTPKGSKRPAQRDDPAEAESEAEAGGEVGEVGEVDDADFDSALERKKSAYASKGGKTADKPPARTHTRKPPTAQLDETDNDTTPATEQPATPPAATVDATTDIATPVTTAEPTTEGEEELAVAGVSPPSSPEPRRTRTSPTTATDTKLQKDASELTGETEEPLAAAAGPEVTAVETTQGETEPLDGLAADRNVGDGQPAVDEDEAAVGDKTAVDPSSVREGEAGGETQEVQAAGEAHAAGVPEEVVQSPATAELNGTLPAGATDSPVIESTEETQAAKGEAVEPEPVNTNTDVPSAVNTEPVPSNGADDSAASPAAATVDLSVAPLSDALSTTNTSADPPTVVAPPEELDLARTDTPQVEAGGGEQAVPPVETPTPRRSDQSVADERDALKATEDAAAALPQTVTDPTVTDPVAPTEPTPLTDPISNVDTPLVDLGDNPATPSTPITDVGTTPTLEVDNTLTDTPNTPESTPVTTPADSTDAPADVPPAADVPPLTDSNNADLPIDTPDSPIPNPATDTDTPTDAITDAEGQAAAEVDSGAWKRSTATSTASFWRRSFTAGLVLCVVIGCLVMIGKKVKETLDSHEDEGSESLLGRLESGQGAAGLLSTGVLSELSGGAGKKDEYDGRVRMKPAIVDEESEEDRYQQQQSKLRSSLGVVSSRGMSLTKQPHLPPAASKKPTLAVQQVDDEEDTGLEEEEEEEEAVEQRRGGEVGGTASAAGGSANGGGVRREKKTSADEGWESFDNDWDD